ncbi:uncharacterized protein LOC135137673 isoform X2 [Zophobas morio]|uniref:uncharacterized protein LOC135137673 isoform X2 n=1 Tax=Zophobas morio TaxID=2755281 RepID=UPI0030827A83
MNRLYKFIYTLFQISVVCGLLHETPNNFTARFLRSSDTGCLLPPHPKNGKWLVRDELKWSPDMTLPNGGFIEVVCDDHYTLEGNENFSNCMNGTWYNEITQCWKKCPYLQKTRHLNITCHNKKGKEIRCSEAADGTKAEFQCDNFYKLETSKNMENVNKMFCSDGTWEDEVPECILDCGLNKYNDPAMVINGTDAKKWAYPWQVAIYDKNTKDLICGGSLLSENVVLTAAHCVLISDYSLKDDIILVVGNYYSKYKHSEDKSAQDVNSIKEIFVPKRYRGRDQNYKNDIAIVVTREKFVITDNVRPICIDLDSRYLANAIKKSMNGYVTGWGFTEEDGKPATVLQELRVQPVDYSSCLNTLSFDFKKFLSRDKLCAGHLNKSMAVCKGDSGGGLFFKDNGIFYVSGIVSVAPASLRAPTDSCDSQQYSLYTNISYHSKFIAEKLISVKDTPELEKCVLPKHPDLGYWSANSTFEDDELSPGHSVKSGTLLKITCRGWYVLKGSKYIICQNGSWDSTLGKCLETCPRVRNTTSMKVKYTYPDDLTSNDDYNTVVDGTLAQFECSPFYEDFSLKKNPFRICVNGKWDLPLPECYPVCGISDEILNKPKSFPWHVAIYTSIEKKLICSGSLINERVVVTAASCVRDDLHNLKPKDSFIVTVGGRYRPFNDFRDSEHIQISEITSIRLESNDIYGNSHVAVIVTKKTLTLANEVLPVCLDKPMVTDGLSNNKHLYISGWRYNIENTKHPDLFKTIEIPEDSITSYEKLIEYNNCSISLFKNKICTGYVDNNSTIWYDNNGAGLVTQLGQRYYLGGIQTFQNFSKSVEACDIQECGIYTKMSPYLLTFILKNEAEFRPPWRS